MHVAEHPDDLTAFRHPPACARRRSRRHDQVVSCAFDTFDVHPSISVDPLRREDRQRGSVDNARLALGWGLGALSSINEAERLPRPHIAIRPLGAAPPPLTTLAACPALTAPQARNPAVPGDGAATARAERTDPMSSAPSPPSSWPSARLRSP